MRRFQFSLSELLWLTAAIGLTVAMLQLDKPIPIEQLCIGPGVVEEEAMTTRNGTQWHGILSEAEPIPPQP
jgi:hypothetical protein